MEESLPVVRVPLLPEVYQWWGALGRWLGLPHGVQRGQGGMERQVDLAVPSNLRLAMMESIMMEMEKLTLWIPSVLVRVIMMKEPSPRGSRVITSMPVNKTAFSMGTQAKAMMGVIGILNVIHKILVVILLRLALMIPSSKIVRQHSP
jgi:hypothetical protein